MASYLDDLLKKANQALITNSKRERNQAMLGSQQPVTNTTRRTTQGIETNNRSQQTQNSSLQTILKQAKAYDPFAIVNKTPDDLKKPLLYLQNQLTGIRPVGYNVTLNSPGLFSGSWFENKDPTSEVNKALVTDLVAKQDYLLGKDLSNIDTKTLASANWTGFNNLAADVEKYKSLRQSYWLKPTKTKVDTDWIAQYDTLLADTYKAISTEIPKILNNARSSYNTISKTRDTGIAAIEALMPLDKQSKKQTKDVATTDQRSQIANRVKLVSNYETKKPNPVFVTRPT